MAEIPLQDLISMLVIGLSNALLSSIVAVQLSRWVQLIPLNPLYMSLFILASGIILSIPVVVSNVVFELMDNQTVRGWLSEIQDMVSAVAINFDKDLEKFAIPILLAMVGFANNVLMRFMPLDLVRTLPFNYYHVAEITLAGVYSFLVWLADQIVISVLPNAKRLIDRISRDVGERINI